MILKLKLINFYPGNSMKSMNKGFGPIKIGLLIVLVGMLLLSGCAPHFQKSEKNEDMGIVYFYRPKKRFDGGFDQVVNANGYKIDLLCNGGYFIYFAKLGRIQFSSTNETTSYVTLDIEPGQTYYIKGFVRPGNLFSKLYLTLVSAEVGEKEIVSCRQIDK